MIPGFEQTEKQLDALTVRGDLISRQAAIDAVELTTWYHQNKNGEMAEGANSQEHQAWYKAEDVYKVLNDLPSAQPERAGRWEMKPDPYGLFDEIPVCSECGYTTRMREVYNFCPNCGAKMEEER